MEGGGGFYATPTVAAVAASLEAIDLIAFGWKSDVKRGLGKVFNKVSKPRELKIFIQQFTKQKDYDNPPLHPPPHPSDGHVTDVSNPIRPSTLSFGHNFSVFSWYKNVATLNLR